MKKIKLSDQVLIICLAFAALAGYCQYSDRSYSEVVATFSAIILYATHFIIQSIEEKKI